MVILPDADTDSLALIEQIRSQVRGLQYTPLDDAALTAIDTATEDAVVDAEFEGVHRTARLAALHRMLLEERAPADIRTLATKRFMQAIAGEDKQVGRAGTV